jgi:hypothetical protein
MYWKNSAGTGTGSRGTTGVCGEATAGKLFAVLSCGGVFGGETLTTAASRRSADPPAESLYNASKENTG